MLGQFNYGKRGILDITHTRLFTFATFRAIFEAAGFRIVSTRGLPAPIPMVVPDPRLGRMLLKLNQWAIHLSRTLFAYQIFMVVEALPTVNTLLGKSVSYTQQRAQQLDTCQRIERGLGKDPVLPL